MVPLDPHLAGGPPSAPPGELAGGVVDRDRHRPFPGHGDGGVARAAAEVEDPLAAHVAEQPELDSVGPSGP